jgi:cell division protein FtsB
MRNLFKPLTKITRYGWAAIIFLALTFVLDSESTLQKRISYDNEIRRLKNEIEFQTHIKETNQQRLDALQTDDESLEKWAREEYRMVKPDEELYIIMEN